jgi:hypothetical protein
MRPIDYHIPKKEAVKGLLSSRISGYRKNCSAKNQTHSIDGRKMTETTVRMLFLHCTVMIYLSLLGFSCKRWTTHVKYQRVNLHGI